MSNKSVWKTIKKLYRVINMKYLLQFYIASLILGVGQQGDVGIYASALSPDSCYGNVSYMLARLARAAQYTN